MREIVIIHKKGEKEIGESVKHRFKKLCLADSMGISPEDLEEKITEAKEFFNLNKKEILREGKISKKKDTEHSSVTSRY